MAFYRYTPPLVEARQFTGGEQNAQDLIDWISELSGYSATWSPAREESTADNGEVLPAAPERLRFVDANDGEYFVEVADWVAKQNGLHFPITAGEFIETYEKVRD